jgi:hypothetical protein
MAPKLLNLRNRVKPWVMYAPVMMPFLKCLAGGRRHFIELRMGDPLAHDPKDRENREGGGFTRL